LNVLLSHIAGGDFMFMQAIQGRIRLTLAALLIFSGLTGVRVHAEGLAQPLAPQLLADALEVFAKQTGVQVFYKSDVAKGIMTRGAAAGRSTEETLRELLRDTNLTFQFVNERTVAILPVSTSDVLRFGNSGEMRLVGFRAHKEVVQRERDDHRYH
jgi:hypothetical protein